MDGKLTVETLGWQADSGDPLDRKLTMRCLGGKLTVETPGWQGDGEILGKLSEIHLNAFCHLPFLSAYINSETET